jgi:hypothetical protein
MEEDATLATINSLSWDELDISDDLDLFNSSPFNSRRNGVGTPLIGSRTSSIRDSLPTLLGQKHNIEDDVHIPFLDGVDYEDSSDDESIDEMKPKMMRRGSVNRIMADSMEARQPASCENLLRSISSDNNLRWGDSRKDLVAMFWRKLNLGDRTGLAEYVRDYCDEVCELTIPDLKDYIVVGKGDIMMFFSLLFEVYPDAIWTVRSVNGKKGVVMCEYTFMGTNIFNKSIDLLFKETRAQSRKHQSIESMGKIDRKKLSLDTNRRSIDDRSTSIDSLNGRSSGSMNNRSGNLAHSRSNGNMLDGVFASSTASQWARPGLPYSKSATFNLINTTGAQPYQPYPSSSGISHGIDQHGIEGAQGAEFTHGRSAEPTTTKEFSEEFGEEITIASDPSGLNRSLYQRPSAVNTNIFRSFGSTNSTNSPPPSDKSYFASFHAIGSFNNQTSDTIIQQSTGGSNPASPPDMFNTNTNKELESMVIKHGIVQQRRQAEFVFAITGINATFGKLVKIIIRDII